MFPRLYTAWALCAITWAAPSTRPQLRTSQGKIVGGQDSLKGQFPYQVSFQEKILGINFHFCGGTIIASDFVVTAAHCVEGADFTSPKGLLVVAGEQDLEQDDGDEQQFHIEFIIEHPFYDPITYENDVALLRLAEPLVFNQLVAPLALPQPGQNFTSEMCLVSGWGTTSEGGSSSNILQYTEIPVVSDRRCRATYTDDEIMDSMICAGYEEGGRDTCQGDSGGPLACGGALAGIVSWGYGCARPGVPGVYTEVTYFLDWINAHTRKH
ncbi:trypsin-1-like [Penaeus chinensis]|uniref:trypsin-1-like n=1 Tax=Penaeus chinensis TaxID=139456 RepID=UPI001FB69FA8|nr:trypsin-1-like [Penaeus chinensis]